MNLLRLGRLALCVADRHTLEDGRVQHHPQHAVGTHDHPGRFLIFHPVRQPYVDFECANAALLPLLVAELEQFRFAREVRLFILLAGFD